jgi:phospholipid/cholesterol/gamma-HCH transport system substrate-binding protein
MNRKLVDVWVGLFVILGFAAILVLALKAGNLASFNFSETYQVLVKFDNIGGLKPRAPVKSSGVVVGRVASIAFDDQTFQAVVTMAMDKRYGFPADSAAKILTSGLLGEQYIGLTAGGDSAKLAQGSRIKDRNTQSAVVLEDLISQFLYSKASDGKPAESGGAGGGTSSVNNSGTGSSNSGGESGAKDKK